MVNENKISLILEKHLLMSVTSLFSLNLPFFCASLLLIGEHIVWMLRQFSHPLYLKHHLYPGRFCAQCHVSELFWGFIQTGLSRKYYTCKRVFIGPGSAILLASKSLAFGKAFCWPLVEFAFYLMKMVALLIVWSNLLFWWILMFFGHYISKFYQLHEHLQDVWQPQRQQSSPPADDRHPL